jgi:hypothetical protein
MTENGIAAMFLEGGSSMFYYTGVRWGNSERRSACHSRKGRAGVGDTRFEEQRAAS